MMVLILKRKLFCHYDSRLRPILMLMLFSCIPLLANCSRPSYENNDATFYSATSIQNNAKSNLAPFEDKQLHYVSIGDNDGIPIVMVHGTPGSWETFKYVLGNTQLQSEFNIASIDRLNWGRSRQAATETKNKQKEEPNYKKQVDAIATIIRHFVPNKKVILVGHSLGSSIVPRVALDFPELVSGMLLLSGTIDPELGDPRWYNHAANVWPVSSFVSTKMSQSNKEIMLLKESLIATKPVWQLLDIPVTVIQGKSDKLVSPQNAEFAKQELAHLGDKFRILELEKVGHFIPWEQTKVIRDELVLLGKKIGKQ